MHSSHAPLRRTIGCLACAFAGWISAPRSASAANLDWKGYSWSVTNGGMAGVAAGSPANVSVDENGYLHLKIQKNGDTWSAAELFTSTRLGFGTYQWQIDGPIDTLDKNVVLGLFPYGPAANIGDDGTNEIDIEYSRWGQATGPNGDWTNYPASGTTIGELSYSFSLSGGTLSTSRFVWTSAFIEDFLLAGLEPPSSTTSVIKSWKYAPANSLTNIPQQALPLGMNLWCYAIPSDGKNVEIIVRDFQFVPEAASVDGAAGAGGMAGNTGGTGGAGSSAAGTVNTAGATALGGTPSSVGGAPSGGAPSNGDAPSNGGATSSGGVASNAGGAQPEASGGKIATPRGDSSSCSVGRMPRSVRGASVAWLALLTPLAWARRRKSARRTGHALDSLKLH